MARTAPPPRLDLYPSSWDANGVRTDLPVPPGSTHSLPSDINDAGTIVGFNNVNNILHAVRWTPDCTITDLGGLGGSFSDVIDLDERGAVAGQSQAADGTSHAVRWSPRGVITALSPGEGRATTMTVLPLLPGDFQGFAIDVNRTGVVAGISGDPFSASRGVVWDSAGIATELAGSRASREPRQHTPGSGLTSGSGVLPTTSG